MTANKDWCQVPDQLVQSFAEDHKRSQQFKGKACGAAAKMAEMEKRAKQQAQQQQGGAGQQDGRRPDRDPERSEGRSLSRIIAQPWSAPARLPCPMPSRAIGPNGWAPAGLRPYLRLARIERPIGWWLLLLPCWWSAALAAIAAGQPWPDPLHCLLFLIGAVAMRGAGCTYNDIVDRDLDTRVERTRQRPLPSGQVTLKGALAFLALQGLVGLLVLCSSTPSPSPPASPRSAIVALYPFMKRFFWMPQIVLGLAFAWGALMGWAAVFGSLGLAPLLLYAGSIAWVVGYDTIYALQDIEDDEIVGIKSSARFFGENVQARRRHLLCHRHRPPHRLPVPGRGGRAVLYGLERFRPSPGLAGGPHRPGGRRGSPAPLPLQPRCGADPVRGDDPRLPALISVRRRPKIPHPPLPKRQDRLRRAMVSPWHRPYLRSDAVPRNTLIAVPRPSRARCSPPGG